MHSGISSMTLANIKAGVVMEVSFEAIESAKS